MPARPALAPGTGPKHLAIIWNTRFPERKIGDRFLGILIALHALTGPHLLEVQLDQLPVLAAATLIFFDAKIDRTISGAISYAPGQQLLNQGNHLGNVLGRTGKMMRKQATQGF